MFNNQNLSTLQLIGVTFISYWQELDHVVEELEKIAVVKLLQHRSIISLIGNVQRSSLILEKVLHLVVSPLNSHTHTHKFTFLHKI